MLVLQQRHQRYSISKVAASDLSHLIVWGQGRRQRVWELTPAEWTTLPNDVMSAHRASHARMLAALASKRAADSKTATNGGEKIDEEKLLLSGILPAPPMPGREGQSEHEEQACLHPLTGPEPGEAPEDEGVESFAEGPRRCNLWQSVQALVSPCTSLRGLLERLRAG
ncbi:unnamed protein product [Symbiodinium sp. CCMP2592]|nr:unnamed protein product [Symbiodinium sp. CCMP2592]